MHHVRGAAGSNAAVRQSFHDRDLIHRSAIRRHRNDLDRHTRTGPVGEVRMNRTMRMVAATVGVALAGGAGGWGATAAADPIGTATDHPAYVVPVDPGPVQTRHAAALRYAEDHPDTAPPGSNDFTCRPAPAHPNPVVLVHGSDSDSYTDWAALSPMLADRGMCVFTLNYGSDGKPGKYARGDMALSAAEVGAFVDRVRAATAAAKVDLVGYSQGATVARYYVNRLGGSAAVDRWVGVASPTYGGNMYGIVTLLKLVPRPERIVEWLTSEAISQQMQGSPFLAALNAGGDTVPGVRYTTVGSRYDEMIQPHTNIALRDPGATNLLIQDLCAENRGGHFNMVYDPFALGLVVRALDPSAPAPPCRPVPLGTGILDMIVVSNS
ncbi:triacylglycerol lipase [Prescottella equi ATCC 33707]|uniref:Triacylglycerol lipase n=2 Tax=Rhodococcus hoagii TaxID=43767 RepID=E9SVL5_RHOHA|nr:triacylglycerol lipase [Prescottella equi ATCC 33707]